MDYKKINEQLIAVRKEIRLNVPYLNAIDMHLELFAEQWEKTIWLGTSAYQSIDFTNQIQSLADTKTGAKRNWLTVLIKILRDKRFKDTNPIG